MALSLNVRKNIKEFESKRDENLSKINQVLNDNFTFECDMEALYEETPESFKNSIGKVIYDQYLNGLAENFAKAMADEMTLEAFLAAVPSKKIVFSVKDLDYSSFIKSAIIDGVYHLVANKKHFPCNFKQAGSDLEKIL